MIRVIAAVFLVLSAVLDAAVAQMRGHGGPVRALAISPDGLQAVSGSFDTSVISWSLSTNAAQSVLRFHDGAVNAVLFLRDGRIVSSGEDARIAIWRTGDDAPSSVLTGHNAPVVGLAVSPDGASLASASWDHTAALWPLAGGGKPRVLNGHAQAVNGVAFIPDGSALVTTGYDATVRIWPLRREEAPVVTVLPSALNALAVAPDGEIVTAGGDGNIIFSPAKVSAKAKSQPGRRRSSGLRYRATASSSGSRASAARSRSSSVLRGKSCAPLWVPACRSGRSCSSRTITPFSPVALTE